MKGVIFGSGLVGMVAKHALPDWEIVPFRRSRFFSFSPPLADNFVTRDKEVDDLMASLGGAISPAFYRRTFSINGQLTSDYDQTLCEAWLHKLFGPDVPPQSTAYFSKRMTLPIYDVRANKLYEALQNKYVDELKAGSALGQVTGIGDHHYVRGGKRFDFDHAISTIPLGALLSLSGKTQPLGDWLPIHYLHVKSTSIDLEGANQALVVDGILDFFKVTCLHPGHYMFQSTSAINNPGAYLLPIIGVSEILDGTMMADVIPSGPIPQLDWLDGHGIFCIGSCAQGDWCADIGSNLLRLVRYVQRGFVDAKPTTIRVG